MTFNTYISDSIHLLSKISEDEHIGQQLEKAVELSVDSLTTGGTIFIAGNGGSAADSQHFATELVSRFMFDREPLRAVALTTDSSILTAAGNDYGYEKVFERQIRGLGREGDVFIGISTSGKSPNVKLACASALEKGLKVITLVGEYSQEMALVSTLCLSIPSNETPHIQEAHEIILHYLALAIEKRIFR
jgi:D-sedoheptulose 7-phosphate isomerase